MPEYNGFNQCCGKSTCIRYAVDSSNSIENFFLFNYSIIMKLVLVKFLVKDLKTKNILKMSLPRWTKPSWSSLKIFSSVGRRKILTRRLKKRTKMFDQSEVWWSKNQLIGSWFSVKRKLENYLKESGLLFKSMFRCVIK